MALTHTIIETRPDGAKYITLIDVLDTVTGVIYNRRPRFKTNPTQAQIDAQVVIEKERIQFDVDCDANAMNLTSDEDWLLEYYRNIKRDIILRIRQVPGATLQQAQDYIAAQYPESMFKFPILYAKWLKITSIDTGDPLDDWADFKTWVIDEKFREID